MQSMWRCATGGSARGTSSSIRSVLPRASTNSYDDGEKDSITTPEANIALVS